MLEGLFEDHTGNGCGLLSDPTTNTYTGCVRTIKDRSELFFSCILLGKY